MTIYGVSVVRGVRLTKQTYETYVNKTLYDNDNDADADDKDVCRLHGMTQPCQADDCCADRYANFLGEHEGQVFSDHANNSYVVGTQVEYHKANMIVDGRGDVLATFDGLCGTRVVTPLLTGIALFADFTPVKAHWVYSTCYVYVPFKYNSPPSSDGGGESKTRDTKLDAYVAQGEVETYVVLDGCNCCS